MWIYTRMHMRPIILLCPFLHAKRGITSIIGLMCTPIWGNKLPPNPLDYSIDMLVEGVIIAKKEIHHVHIAFNYLGFIVPQTWITGTRP